MSMADENAVDQADTIHIDNDAARDAVAITRLLRTNQADMALFIIKSYGSDVLKLHALIGAFAALASDILSSFDMIADQHSTEVTLPSSSIILASIAENVANWEPDHG
jgi:hypothetical protein